MGVTHPAAPVRTSPSNQEGECARVSPIHCARSAYLRDALSELTRPRPLAQVVRRTCARWLVDLHPRRCALRAGRARRGRSRPLRPSGADNPTEPFRDISTEHSAAPPRLTSPPPTPPWVWGGARGGHPRRPSVLRCMPLAAILALSGASGSSWVVLALLRVLLLMGRACLCAVYGLRRACALIANIRSVSVSMCLTGDARAELGSILDPDNDSRCFGDGKVHRINVVRSSGRVAFVPRRTSEPSTTLPLAVARGVN